MAETRHEQQGPAGRERPLRLDDAGDNRSAWVTLLTTEHYALQGSRSSTISEANGRASIFLGAVSAGLIALGFQGGGRGAATTVFQVAVLTALGFLGLVTCLRCLEISIDDYEFSARVDRLREVYVELAPELEPHLRAVAGQEQAMSMLTRRRQPFQLMLTVAGTVGVVTGMILGADAGVLAYGLGLPLGGAVTVGAVVCAACVFTLTRFQAARWRGATTANPGAVRVG